MSDAANAKHPALNLFILSAICLLLAVVLSFISVYIPWGWKDIAVGQRLYAAPFKHCIEYTFSPLNAEFCQDNDFSAEDNVSGGNTKCRGFIVATIVFVFIMVITGVVTLIVFGLMFWKFLGKPLAILIQFGIFVVFISSLLSWIMWITYANITCKEGSVIFPVKSYSYGFVCQVFATFLTLVALILGYMGIMRLSRYQPPAKGEDEEQLVEQPYLYPAAYDVMQADQIPPTPYWTADPTVPVMQQLY